MKKSIPTPVLLLLLLVAADLVFIALHAAHYLGHVDRHLFTLTSDRGYAESFQYIKEFWIALLFGILALTQRKFIFGVASAFFLYLLVDDAMQVHETLGESIAAWLGLQPAFGMRAKDFGELLVSATVGGGFVILACLAFVKGGRAGRTICRDLAIWCGLLVFFGVFIDMVNIIMVLGPSATAAMSAVEDGGEMLVMSLMVCYCFMLHSQTSPNFGLRLFTPKTPASPTLTSRPASPPPIDLLSTQPLHSHTFAQAGQELEKTSAEPVITRT